MLHRVRSQIARWAHVYLPPRPTKRESAGFHSDRLVATPRLDQMGETLGWSTQKPRRLQRMS